jgi:uncharacterized protein involved in outer membrane biogenesis
MPLLPLLVGDVRPRLIDASGIRLNLVRLADGRANWRGADGRKSDDDHRHAPDLGGISVHDARIRYRDARQKRAFDLAVTIDPAHGLVADGTGTVDGAPVRIAARGGAMIADRPWPFTARIDGPALGMQASGHMAGPLRTDAMTLRMSARADDLKRLDRVIEAGLFGTRPLTLAATVRRTQDAWIVTGLTGRIGSSPLAGNITARKVEGRTKLDGRVRFARLDFEDLATDAGTAAALALERREGRRLVPNLLVDIGKIDRTDGRVAVRIDRIVSAHGRSTLTDLSGALALDHLYLTARLDRLGMGTGRIAGTVTVDQRGGRTKPLVTLALDLTGGRVAQLAGGGGRGTVDGRLDGRIRLVGTGSTVREAVGRSDGVIGLAVASGSLPSKLAALMGFDIGRGLLLGDDARPATLRCGTLRLAMRGGRGTIAPLLIDTSLSQARGTGTIRFPDERIDATLTGSPKGNVGLRIAGTIRLQGTIRAPDIVIPQETRSTGNILKAIGRAIAGGNSPKAPDADCAALRRQALTG